jgi:maltooligosyltrehalose trehalohydrolase
VVFAQNHDHIGNRMRGDRLSQSLNLEQLKLVAATYLLSPYVPLVFMGEEFGEDRPFTYFISHTDDALVEAVRQGRKKEFEYFHRGEGQVPDPQSEATFMGCKLDWNFSEDPQKKTLFNYYRQLIRFRKTNPAFRIDRRGSMEVKVDEARQVISIERFENANQRKSLFYAVLNYGNQDTEWPVRTGQSNWQKCLDSADTAWLGPASQAPETLSSGDVLPLKKHSVLLYEYRQEQGERA